MLLWIINEVCWLTGGLIICLVKWSYEINHNFFENYSWSNSPKNHVREGGDWPIQPRFMWCNMGIFSSDKQKETIRSLYKSILKILKAKIYTWKFSVRKISPFLLFIHSYFCSTNLNSWGIWLILNGNVPYWIFFHIKGFRPETFS